PFECSNFLYDHFLAFVVTLIIPSYDHLLAFVVALIIPPNDVDIFKLNKAPFKCSNFLYDHFLAFVVTLIIPSYDHLLAFVVALIIPPNDVDIFKAFIFNEMNRFLTSNNGSGIRVPSTVINKRNKNLLTGPYGHES
ncbi:hypothetical protein PHLCEN_2v8151, partial [Hermanssonia centrifuga]